MKFDIRKRALGWVFLTMVFLAAGFAFSRAEAGQPKLIAPGGAEIDFVHNITKCFGTSVNPVEAHWKNFSIETNYLVYNRSEETARAIGKVKIIQEIPVYKVVTCRRFFLDLKRDFITAEKGVTVIYDEKTSLAGDSLEWDRKNDFVKIEGSARINHEDWQIDGERIEGQINKGLFTVFGPVKGAGTDISFKAGQVVFDRSLEKIFLKNNPIVIQGKNQFTAFEIVYDLKTRKVSTKSETKAN
jgi:lipopolysaccharide export system protein LptA